MKAIYDSIGEGYDTTRRADPKIVSTLADLLRLDMNGYYLDVACGTGNYTAALARSGGTWEAFDQSETMLREARKKSDAVSWHNMDVMKIDFPENAFDGITCTLAIHHFPQIGTPFDEVARVLKPSGNFALFTAFPHQMRRYWLVEYFPEMMDLACRQMPNLEDIDAALQKAGLHVNEMRPFYITPELKDFFLYSGKQRPEMYLSQAVRSGISSFRNGYCSETELASGLAKLRSDIDSGQIHSVIARYGDAGGDYTFVQSEKLM